MEIEELLKTLDSFDEMENETGLNTVNEELVTFDEQKRVLSKVTGLNLSVVSYADAVCLVSGINKTKTYKAEEDKEKIAKVSSEIYDVAVETLRNLDQRIENILKENNFTEI